MQNERENKKKKKRSKRTQKTHGFTVYRIRIEQLMVKNKSNRNNNNK